jgi:hypothetical protein
MTEEYPSAVSLCFERKNAERIRKAIFLAVNKLPPLSHEAITLQNLGNEIFEGLAPWFIYEVKCKDCPRTFKHKSKKPFTKDEIDKGGVCSNCSDDYK